MLVQYCTNTHRETHISNITQYGRPTRRQRSSGKRPKVSATRQKLCGDRHGARCSRCQKSGSSFTFNDNWGIENSRLGGMQVRNRDRWEGECLSPRFSLHITITVLPGEFSVFLELRGYDYIHDLEDQLFDAEVLQINLLVSVGHVKLELLHEETIESLLEALRLVTIRESSKVSILSRLYKLRE